ncbi:MAG: hypothetical protein A3J83_04685 [Elusimicrobia bacterium RIFOXYA2_FULL_40_6]|nr:MAG: hypothetical protein A3J83_04685 [Elusimicrobia bacterium RIFOXYA2_FULL_40_6]
MKYFAIVILFMFGITVKARSLELDYYPAGETSGLPLEALSAFTGNAHASGVGNAFTAHNGNASGSYWNPAGISGMYYNEIDITNCMLFNNTQLLSASFAYPLNEKNVFGINIIRLTSGEAERTDSLGDSLGYTFSENLTATYFTFSRKVKDKLACGINLKVVNQSLDTYSAQGQGLDAGIIYKSNNETTYGLAVQNIIPVQIGGGPSADTAGANLKAGLMNAFLRDKFIGYLDASMLGLGSSQSALRWAAGLEYKVSDSFWLRGGLNTREFSLGFGLMTDKIDFDYAVSAHPIDFVHKLSVNIRYGYTPTEAELKMQAQSEALADERAKYLEEKKIQKAQLREEQRKLKIENWVHTKMFIAQDHFRKDKYTLAEQVLKEVLERDPNHEAAKELLKEINKRTQVNYIAQKYIESMNLYKYNRFSEALETSGLVINLDSSHNGAKIVAFLSRAHIFLQGKKYEDAKSELIELLKIDPNNNEAVVLLKRIQAIVDIMGKQ